MQPRPTSSFGASWMPLLTGRREKSGGVFPRDGGRCEVEGDMAGCIGPGLKQHMSNANACEQGFRTPGTEKIGGLLC